MASPSKITRTMGPYFKNMGFRKVGPHSFNFVVDEKRSIMISTHVRAWVGFPFSYDFYDSSHLKWIDELIGYPWIVPEKKIYRPVFYFHSMLIEFPQKVVIAINKIKHSAYNEDEKTSKIKKLIKVKYMISYKLWYTRKTTSELWGANNFSDSLASKWAECFEATIIPNLKELKLENFIDENFYLYDDFFYLKDNHNQPWYFVLKNSLALALEKYDALITDFPDEIVNEWLFAEKTILTPVRFRLGKPEFAHFLRKMKDISPKYTGKQITLSSFAQEVMDNY